MRRYPPQALLAAAVLLLFGPLALRCGLYLDDYSFIPQFSGTWGDVWRQALHYYIPGRNLYPLYYGAILKLTAGNVLGLHAFQLALDALNVCLAYGIARVVFGDARLALSCGLLTALLPHHGETHFWATLGPQVLLPSSFALAGVLFAGAGRGAGTAGRRALGARLAGGLALFALALFAYDQFFFFWPLILAAAWHGCGPADRGRRAPWLAAAAAGLAVCGAFWALREAGGHQGLGRPDTAPLAALGRAGSALLVSLRALAWPLPSGPPLGAAAKLLAALAAGAVLLALPRAAEDRRGADRGRGSLLHAAGFGLAWWALAYLPNWLSYIAPRSHYLPSFGWAIFLTACAAGAARRWAAVGKALPFAAAGLGAYMAVANVHEGAQWVDSGRLHERYAELAAPLARADGTLLLLGAPRFLGRAPAFSLPHDSVLNAGLAAGATGLDGGNEAALTRRGAFYLNTPSLWGADAFRWTPRAGLRVLGWSPGRGFECFSDFHLRLPDGTELPGAFDPAPACKTHADFGLKAALLSARRIPPPEGGAALPWLAGALPAAIQARATGDRLFLTIDWRVERAPGFSFAIVARLVDGDGRVAFEPLYKPGGHAAAAPVLWPLVNDELPPEAWRENEGIREEYALELERPLPPGEYRLLATFYRLRPRAASERLGTLELRAAL